MPIVRESVNVTDTGGFISRVSWGSILLGVVVALGVMLLLALLGIALGFSLVDPQHDAQPLSGIPIGTAIYFIISQIISLATGGYAAARLASSAWTSAAVLHGAAVWALAAILMLLATVSGVGAVISGTNSLVSTVTGGAAQAVRAAVPNNLQLPDFGNVETLIPDNFVSTLPPEVQQSLGDANVTVEDIRRESRAILNDVINEQERQRAREAATNAAASIVRNPARADEEIDQLYNQLVGDNGLISEQDRRQALQSLEDRLGIAPEEAEAMFNQWQQTMENTADTVRNTLNDVKTKAVEVAQNITSAIGSAAWWAFIISLIGLLAAIGGAMLGRPDPDTHHVASRS